MADLDDVRRVALGLPEAVAQGSGFRVAGKQFAWTWQERVEGRRARVPRPDVLVVRVADEGEKQSLIEAAPETFFTEPHYDGYAAVQVRLGAVDADELAELVIDAWRTRAPRRLVRELDELRVRPRRRADEQAVQTFLARWGAVRIARRGALELALDHPALLAERGGRLAGVLTYVVSGAQCEVLSLHAAEPHTGVGSALIDAVRRVAVRADCLRLWVITTNDNVDALRFYQRRGFRLAALHRGAVDDSRTRLKPEIPELGEHGIALRDELELEQDL